MFKNGCEVRMADFTAVFCVAQSENGLRFKQGILFFFSVCCRRTAVFFAESGNQPVAVFVTDGFHNLLQCHIGFGKEKFRPGKFAVDDVFLRGRACHFPKNLGKVFSVEVEIIRQFRDGYRGKMPLDIVAGALNE